MTTRRVRFTRVNAELLRYIQLYEACPRQFETKNVHRSIGYWNRLPCISTISARAVLPLAPRASACTALIARAVRPSARRRRARARGQYVATGGHAGGGHVPRHVQRPRVQLGRAWTVDRVVCVCV
eukprot:scaffold36995_cov66-Phaeocystis_antarctica.AAC.2